VYFVLNESNCRKVRARPGVMVASDATAQRARRPTIEGMPHPRAYGTFSRVLGHYRRDETLLTLEQAVAKMTSMPAAQLGLADRGRIADGARADLVVFDPRHVRTGGRRASCGSSSRGCPSSARGGRRGPGLVA
jgi:N-acyl-D-aspartate/D-glutamate deacylase